MDSSDLRDALENVRRQAMLRELYLREVRDKAKVSKEELRRAYRYWRQELTVAFYHALTLEEAEWVRRGVLAGKSFAELAGERYKRKFSEDQFQRKLRWGETDPALEAAAYALRVGEVSEPVKVGQVYYVVKLLNRRMLGSPSEEDFKRVAPALEKKLRRRKEDELAARFLRQHLVQAGIQLRGPVLSELVQYLGRYAGPDSIVELTPETLDSLLAEFEWRDSALVVFSGKKWTVKEALKRIEGVRLSAFSPELMADRLSRALFEAARDEVLVEAAKDLGLDKHPRVQRDVNVWRDYVAAEIFKRRAGTSRVLAVVDSLREHVPVLILRTKLASLQFTSPDTTLGQQSTPFRQLAFPPWPVWDQERATNPSR
ncbi:MAG TPA: peptidylprolyl isomerase [Bacteroidetes bacterium]|nr:peptidylprolyl isomerase [Bacteroidota bacterium]